MAQPFSWFRPGFKLVTANLEWNIQVPFLQNSEGNGERLKSIRFIPKELSGDQWKLKMYEDNDTTELDISAFHYNSAGEREDLVDPVLVKMSIINQKKQKVLQQMTTSQPDLCYVQFLLDKEDIIQSECQQEDGSYTFRFKILCHVKKEPVSSDNPHGVAMNCTDQLATQLEGLFDSMQYSDVNFNVGGRDFTAHKNILATRSKVFDTIFKYPSKEDSSDRITIGDIEPEVFHEMLRFIYTGRVTLAKMESLAAGLLIAADKYWLDQLKIECENYLLVHMSTVNCAELLLHTDLLFPTERLKKESVKYFWRFPEEVMTTDKWKKVKQENPDLLCKIQEFVCRNK